PADDDENVSIHHCHHPNPSTMPQDIPSTMPRHMRQLSAEAKHRVSAQEIRENDPMLPNFLHSVIVSAGNSGRTACFPEFLAQGQVRMRG
ncbi:hypothetical protein, partial [Bifidobacterium ramosum]|uniref:hypothetical protein n=1 Tax=Bifidobacterium ramosum TaxID=1798158 RepID=UPI00197A9335